MIEIQAVTKVYSGAPRGTPVIAALHDISLSVAPGEFVTIVGPSGCGKSTLLNLVAGFEKPTRGRIVVAGREIHQPGADRVVIFQNPNLYPWLSVRDNIAFGLRLRDGRRLNWHAVDELIEAVGLVGFERHKPYQLSGGMQQRVAIARALIMRPQVLLMDEPFGALDAQTRGSMQLFVLDLWQRISATVLFITHDIDEAILLGDRLVVMTPRPGKVATKMEVALGRPRGLNTLLDPNFLAIKRSVFSWISPEHSAVFTEDAASTDSVAAK
jgi:NitT/TauT family transport system ATP-binding protein